MGHPDARLGGAPDLTLGAALLPVGALFLFFVTGAVLFGVSVEMLIAAMLSAAVVAGTLVVRTGGSWADIQRSTGDKVAAVLPVILILLTIGMLVGSWVLSGTIPLLVAWGIQLVHPGLFVLTAFVATSIMSLCTGTSFGSAGTLGVALMGAAEAMGVPLSAAAGAIVSGAYLGDKMSPLSDSTNICAIGARADLYAHIRHMLYTAVPSAVLAAIVYALLAGGSATVGGLPPEAGRLLAEIDAVFSPGPIATLPVVVVLGGIVARVPPVLALASSALLALILGVAAQGFGVQQALTAAVHGFDVEMIGALGRDPATLSGSFVRLMNRGGLYSMTNTLVVILSAFLFAACLEVSGALDRILRALLSAVGSTFGLIGSTMLSGGTMIALTSHGGVTALIVGEMFQKAYRDRGFAPQNLSRSLEDSVTIVEPLMPWTVSAIFMATTLGVPTVVYAPWAAFCFGGPVFSLLIAATFDRLGFGIARVEPPGHG